MSSCGAQAPLASASAMVAAIASADSLRIGPRSFADQPPSRVTRRTATWTSAGMSPSGRERAAIQSADANASSATRSAPS